MNERNVVTNSRRAKRIHVKNILDRLYAKYNHRQLIPPDPLQFVYKYTNRADMEIAGFLAAVLAYGRVQQIEKSVTNLLGRMGNHPADFVRSFNSTKRKKLSDFKHRFTTGDDISDLLTLLKGIIKSHGSIEAYFASHYNDTDSTIIPALTCFCDSLSAAYAAKHNGHVSRGLKYLLVNPARGSACKRLNMFLRWMVRQDDVDTGLWQSIDKAKLVVPIDVHMGRLCKILNLYNQKTTSLKAALDITAGFAAIEPTDPTKYDFALSRVGIIEGCTGKQNAHCIDCELQGFCGH